MSYGWGRSQWSLRPQRCLQPGPGIVPHSIWVGADKNETLLDTLTFWQPSYLWTRTPLAHFILFVFIPPILLETFPSLIPCAVGILSFSFFLFISLILLRTCSEPHPECNWVTFSFLFLFHRYYREIAPSSSLMPLAYFLCFLFVPLILIRACKQTYPSCHWHSFSFFCLFHQYY